MTLCFRRYCSARSPSTASLLGLHPKCSSSHRAIFGGRVDLTPCLLQAPAGRAIASQEHVASLALPSALLLSLENIASPVRRAPVWLRQARMRRSLYPPDAPALRTRCRWPHHGQCASPVLRK